MNLTSLSRTWNLQALLTYVMQEVANKCEPDVENNTRLSIAVTVSIIVIVILAIAAACIVSITLLVCWFMPGCLIHHKRSQHGPAKDLSTVTH